MGFREVPVFEVKEVLRLWLRGEALRSIERLARVDRKTVRRYVAAAVEARRRPRRRGGPAERRGPRRRDRAGPPASSQRPRRVLAHPRGPRRADPRLDRRRGAERRQGPHPAGPPGGRRPETDPRALLRRAVRAAPWPEEDRPRRRRRTRGRAPGRLRPHGPHVRPRHGSAPRRPRAHLHAVSVALFLRVAHLLPDAGRHPLRLRGGLGLLRRDLRRRDPRQHGRHRRQGRTRPSRASTPPSSSTPRTGASSSTPPGCAIPRTSPGSSAWCPTCGAPSSPASTSSTCPTPSAGPRQWCTTTAGLRVHGTTACRPAEHFATARGSRPRPRCPSLPMTCRTTPRPRWHRDHHVEVAKALYSVPGNLIGRHLDARADKELVKLFFRGQLVKVHPRQAPGGRSTDPADLPKGTEVYALRDLERLKNMAAAHGPGRRCLRGRAARPPAAVDQDAPGLRPVGPGQEVGPHPRRRGVCPRGRSRGLQRRRSSVACSSGAPRVAPSRCRSRAACSRRASPDPTPTFVFSQFGDADRDDAADPDRGSEATTAGASS